MIMSQFYFIAVLVSGTASAERYAGNDKARDEPSFVDLYGILLDPIKDSVRNVTEVGVLSSSSEVGVAYRLSVEMWNEFFPSALIWGVEAGYTPKILNSISHYPRFRKIDADSTKCEELSAFGFTNESMDVIIDGGPHGVANANDALLSCLWRTLRPGGLYFVEDQRKYAAAEAVSPGKLGLSALMRFPESTSAAVRAILEENDCFFADTALGHRAWERSQHVTPTATFDRANHNSNVLVIRKRPSRSTLKRGPRGTVATP
jgi:hypothetical protein